MDITGARSGLESAEAVLKLRLGHADQATLTVGRSRSTPTSRPLGATAVSWSEPRHAQYAAF
jgi:hypothetical protein